MPILPVLPVTPALRVLRALRVAGVELMRSMQRRDPLGGWIHQISTMWPRVLHRQP